jgi:hypothetical protein
MHEIWHHIASILGLTDINGPNYAFWSGIGSDLAEFGIVLAIFRGFFKARKQRDQHHEQLKRHIDYKFTKLTDEETN